MKRFLGYAALALIIGTGAISSADAQVFVRAPFVRVQVGGGVYVRAPFVNLYVPPRPVIMAPYMPPPVTYAPPMPRLVESPPPQVIPPQPAPQPKPQQNDDPEPIQQGQAPTLEQFAKSFQPKAGNYAVTIINPVTNEPVMVRFSLPAGNPRQVHLRRNEIEFDYGIRRFVRIEFDNEGVMVTTR